MLIWTDERNDKQVKIKWQFTTTKARDIMDSQYVKVNPKNLNYKET